MYSEAEIYRSQIVEAVMQSPGSQQYLNPGRVVVVKSESVSSLSYLVPSSWWNLLLNVLDCCCLPAFVSFSILWSNCL